MQYPDLKDRVVVVTGAGRFRSIGTAICRAFADQGCSVFFTTNGSYDKEMYPADAASGDPGQLADELRQRGILAAYMEADLADPDCGPHILDSVQKQLGEPSILINNAASSARDGFEKLDAGGLDAHYAVNVRGPALLSVEFARRFSGKSGGRIIYLTS